MKLSILLSVIIIFLLEFLRTRSSRAYFQNNNKIRDNDNFGTRVNLNNVIWYLCFIYMNFNILVIYIYKFVITLSNHAYLAMT
jgi:hypothetical protein